jgi:hypothetical protein
MTRSVTMSTQRLVLVTAAGALAAVALIFAAAHTARADSLTATAQPAVTPKALAFRQGMNKLWEDHITWTRMVIVDFAANLPDLKTAEARLLRNQADIGNAIKPYYGNAAGKALTAQLRTHILIAADLIAAAKAGDQAKLADAQARWTANADQIAATLHSVNPQAWGLDAMKAEMHQHLKLTTEEALARLHGDWNADVAAYDKVLTHILRMSDMLTSGIVDQFPARFR